MSEPDYAHYGVTSEGRVYFSKPLSEWTDAELSAALHQIEERVPALERAIERLMDIYEQFTGARDARAAVYLEIAEAFGVNVPEGDG